MNQIEQMNWIFDKLANAMTGDHRFARQRAIEEAITSFNPNREEALDMLDAILASVNRKYQDNADGDVEYFSENLRQSIALMEERP